MSLSVTTPQFLMCPPFYFTVTYKINPWMNPEAWQQNGENWVKSRNEWVGLFSTLQELGCGMHLLAPESHVPDLVFTANSAFVLNGTAIVSNFRHKERQPEANINRPWFERFGLKVVEIAPTHEGGGDALFDPVGGCVWMGYGFRTDREALAAYAKVLGCEVIPLPLLTENFYHLDTCFCPLSKGHLLYYPAAFPPESLATLKARASDRLLAVSDAEGAAFACNAVCVGDHVILPDDPRIAQGPTVKRLQELGYTVHLVDLQAFMLGGGSAKCLTLRLDERVS